jgi:hypothetical protein
VLTEIVLGTVGWILTARHIGRVRVLQLSWRIVLAGLIMGVVVFPLRDMSGIAIALPIIVGVAVYASAVLLLRVVSAEEIAWARRAVSLAR